ncbi:hypothetical protein LCGC14_2186390 [marine sediment metagenome]|uniref:Uncharacterized protein n=1 Tax=marine sediment metagenome TaxID=412755 RepID=A0A0F9DL20_9ZZZZ
MAPGDRSPPRYAECKSVEAEVPQFVRLQKTARNLADRDCLQNQPSAWCARVDRTLCKEKPKMRVLIQLTKPRLYDLDNFVGGCKPIIDSLKRLGLIHNDSPHWLDLQVEQIQRSKMRAFTRIEICPVDNG